MNRRADSFSIRNSKFEIRNSKFALITVLAVWAITTFLWLQPGVLLPDGAGYYVYLPSITLDHDLLFFDEWQHLGLLRGGVIEFKDATDNGHMANHWTSGPSMLWFPTYIAGHAIAKLTHFPQNGISIPYNVPVIFTSAAAGLIALLLGVHASMRWGERPALTAALGVWFGSPLMWYSLRHSTMSHAVGAAACAAVVALSLRLRERMDVERLFAVGLAVGFAFDVRPQNAPFILVPLIIAWGTGNRAFPDRRNCLSYSVGVAVAALPQLVVGQILWGTPLAFVNIGAKGNDWQSFTHVRLWEVLFDSYHGLAVWTPLLLLALIGFALLYKDDRRLGIAAIAMFAIQWLMIATLDRAWWGGAAFGQRRLDNCTIFFILGLAALFSRLSAPLSIAVTALTSLWTLALFFTTFDLNAYQSFGELARGALHAQWRLSFVPPTVRAAVWLMMLVTALLLIAIVAVLRRVNATAVVGAYFLAFAALFAWCGSHDVAHMPPWRAVIAANRAHPTAIPVTNIGVVRHEAAWLAGKGRITEARRAFAEADAMAKHYGVP